MSDVYIVEACRSPNGKRGKGLAGMKPADLLGLFSTQHSNVVVSRLKILAKLLVVVSRRLESRHLTLLVLPGSRRDFRLKLLPPRLIHSAVQANKQPRWVPR